MIQPSFASSKWNMDEILILLAKNDGKKWSRNDIF